MYKEGGTEIKSYQRFTCAKLFKQLKHRILANMYITYGQCESITCDEWTRTFHSRPEYFIKRALRH